MSSKYKLTPRNRSTLQVLIVARISGCASQKDMSLEDQIDHAKEEIADKYQGAVEYHPIATKGKGERNDRPELKVIEDLLRTKKYDVLIAEDLGRIMRGAEAAHFCGTAVDNGTRVITINDCIDTFDETWEEEMISACRDHVGHNSHTSKRIKQKQMNRFRKEGRSIARETYGYKVPDNAKKYDEWQRDESATPIFREWFRMLREGAGFSEVADMLNSQNVARGPYCRNQKWDCGAVGRLTRNPILKGMAGRGFRKTVKHHGSGRRISVHNPDGPTYWHCPHLAHVEPEVWDQVNQLMSMRNKAYRGAKVPGQFDPRKDIPSKRTIWPGQHSICGVCGRKMYWGSHFKKKYLICSGAMKYLCWNAITCDGKLIAKRILETIHREVSALPDFDSVFRERIQRAAAERTSAKTKRLHELDRKITELNSQIDRLVNAIAEIGTSAALKEKLTRSEQERNSFITERIRLQAEPDDLTDLPPHSEVIRIAREKCAEIDPSSPEAGRFLSALCPVVEFRPFELFATKSRDLRAFVTMNFAPLVAADHFAGLGDVFVRHAVVDGFIPPIHVRHREEVMRMKSAGIHLRDIAKAIGIAFGSVQNTIEFHNKLVRAGRTDPYEAMTVPPDGLNGRYCRQNHVRFNFTPLPGFPWWTREQSFSS